MTLYTQKTHWIFLSASPNDSEERHIYDVAFGVLCLESKGISPEDITIIIDGSDRTLIKNTISIATPHSYTIITSDQLFPLLLTNDYDNIVLIVTGHGSIDGISSTNLIKPYPLFEAVKTAPNLNRGIIILGQCYAGAFNYLDVINPPLVVLGATNLFLSISSNTEEQFLTTKKPWSANLFLLYLFKWIKDPVDVDGDGKFTIVDAFKYASNHSNNSYRQIKINSMHNFYDALFKRQQSVNDIDKYINTHPTARPVLDDYIQQLSLGNPNAIDILHNYISANPSESALLTLVLEWVANFTKFNQIADVHLNHQESWILNAHKAREIVYI